MTSEEIVIDGNRFLPQDNIDVAGQNGDCYRACLATMLCVDSRTLPHFYEIVEDFNDVMDDFLNANNLLRVTADVRADEFSMDEALEYFGGIFLNVPYMFIGNVKDMPPKMGGHAAVAINGKIVHDPAVGVPGKTIISIPSPAPTVEAGCWSADYFFRRLTTPVASSDFEELV